MFVLAAVFLLSMSGVYHMLDIGTGRSVLKRLDAAGVYVLIAGTCTPPILILLRGRQRLLFLIAAWAMAATFVPLRVVFFSLTEGIIGGLGPLFMGWMGATLVWVLASRWGWKAMLPLVHGGLAYTVGVALVPFPGIVLIPGVIGVHELWHVAVLVGLGFHWSFIDRICSLRPEDVAAADSWEDLMAVADARRPEWRGRAVLGAGVAWVRRRGRASSRRPVATVGREALEPLTGDE